MELIGSNIDHEICEGSVKSKRRFRIGLPPERWRGLNGFSIMRRTFILFLFLILLLPVSAKSEATAEMIAIYDVAFVMDLFRSDHGRLPTRWEELVDGGYLSGVIGEKAQRLLDIKNRYAFVDMPPLRIGPESVQIFLMAKQPGGEGDNFEALELDKVKGRWVFTADDHGRVGHRRFTEKTLRIWFSKAGLDLADYTFDAPRSPSYRTSKEIAVYFRLRPWLKYSCLGVVLGGGLFLWWEIRVRRRLAAE